MAAAAPRLRPTAIPGVTAATLAALFDRAGGGFDDFEAEAARLFGARYAIVVGSARAGLATVLEEQGCRPGDEIVIPSYTAPCIPAFLRGLGYRLRTAPICPKRLVVTAETLKAALGPRTRAVLPTHVEGITAPMTEIVAAMPKSVVVVEDAAHALGAAVDGRPVGTQSSAAVHSFGKGKHLNTVFGGLVVTDDPGIAIATRKAREALPPPTKSRLLGGLAIELAAASATHPRLYPLVLHPLIRACALFGIDLPTRLFEDDGSGPAAAVMRRPPRSWARLARQQLPGFNVERARRRSVASSLRTALAERGLRYQQANDPGDHPLFLTLFAERREELRQALLAEGQDTQPTWMRSITGDEGEHDPIADQAEREGLYLPLHVGVDPESVIAALDRARARLAP